MATFNKQTLTLQFENWGDFVETASTCIPTISNPARINSIGSRSDLFGGMGANFAQTVELAKMGWQDGIAKINKLFQGISAEVSSQMLRDEYFYDVTGQDFDLDRVLIGEPESWLQTEQVVVQAPSLQVLKVTVNIATSHTIANNQIINRGAAIASLVQLLEQSRRRVELEIVDTFEQNGRREKVATIRIPAKNAGDDLDLNKLAFALIHPCMERRLIFALEECYFPTFCSDYGIPCGMPDLSGVDISIPQMSYHNSEQWRNMNTAKAWVIKELQKQGVELKESL